MKIAMETSIFFPSNGGADGMGRYAQNIYKGLNTSKEVDMKGFCLPLNLDKQKALQENQIILPKMSFNYELLRSYIFYSSFETFFKTDDLLFLPNFYRIPIVKQTPMVATIHDSIPLSHPEWVYSNKKHQQKKNFRLKHTVSLLDRVICISEFAAKDVIKHFGISENNIDIIYHGIDQKFFQLISLKTIQNILAQYSLLPKKYILHVSNLQPRKNQFRLLEGYEKLPNHLKEEYPLIIVGKHAWRCDNVIQKLKQLEINNEVRWLTNINDETLLALYQGSACFVFPSLYEGFGFPILEAFASNTPVITSNIGAMREIAGNGNAYFIDPYNENELSDAIKDILTNLSLRKILIQRGHAHAKKFTWEKSIKEHIDVFKKMT